MEFDLLAFIIPPIGSEILYFQGKLAFSKSFSRHYLKCRRGAQPSDYLFPGRKPGSHLSDGAVQSFLKKRLEELGWQNRGFHFHSLRHAHALFYYQNGADLFQVQTRLRHNTIASTIIYVQLDAELKGRTRVAGPFDDAGYQI